MHHGIVTTPLIRNGLDTELKSISDLNYFKTKLKTILIEKRCPSF